MLEEHIARTHVVVLGQALLGLSDLVPRGLLGEVIIILRSHVVACLWCRAWQSRYVQLDRID